MAADHMSKVFEALRKGQSEIFQVLLPPVENGATVVVASEVPKPPAIAAAVELAPVPAVSEPLAPEILPEADNIRTLPLLIAERAPLMPFEEDHWRAVEQYRIIRTKVIHHPKQPRMILISSAGAGDGKSVTAANLAGALALKMDSTVLLMDGDFRRSTLCSELGLPETPGLSEVLGMGLALEQALIRSEQFPNLYVLPAGKVVENPTELIDSAQWTSLCTRLRERFRYIIVDSPPIGAVADYDLLQAACDGVIMVLRPDHTNRQSCLKALEILGKEKLLGVVMNCVHGWFLGHSYGAGYSYKRYVRGPASPDRN
jgi:capsular exopolysaccharide synthesis family protein